ncbi:MAG: hypothetical protein WC755_07730, partial [Candidatus Woesearchaeota archaeon]
ISNQTLFHIFQLNQKAVAHFNDSSNASKLAVISNSVTKSLFKDLLESSVIFWKNGLSSSDILFKADLYSFSNSTYFDSD